MPLEKQAPGPVLETYIETRLNLLTVSIEKLDRALRERIDAVEAASIARKDHLASEIEHAKKMLQTAQENLREQSGRAEKTQHDINIASNEWRTTLNDFRGNVPTKDELNRFYAEFGAYKLEIEKRTAIALGERSAKVESKDDWKSIAALVIALAAAALAYFSKH